MALGYLLIGILSGASAGTVAFLAESSLLTVLLAYVAFGQVGMIGAMGVTYLRPLRLSND